MRNLPSRILTYAGLGFAFVLAQSAASWYGCGGGATTSECGECPQGTACVDGECKVVCAGDSECTDNDVCNGIETCEAGACQAGVPLQCDDNDPCTFDRCDATAGCVNTNTCCSTPADCDDSNPCTDDDCTLTGACTHVNNTDSCSDGDVCNGVETCGGGSCQSGTPLNCNDNNPCTDDTCDAVTGCDNTNDDTNSCADSDLCDGTESCGGGACLPGAPLNCDDGNACTLDSCETLTGCSNVNTCGCVFDSECDDSNPCTDDVCVGTCSNLPNTISCSDGDACNGVEVCAAGSCQPGAPPNCDDGNPCTDDSCDPSTGCGNANVASGEVRTGCNAAAAGPCSLAERCNGDGACIAGNLSDGSQPNGCSECVECQSGACVAVAQDAQRPGCDGGDTTCSQSDRCDGGGNCDRRHLSDGSQPAGCTVCLECQTGVCAVVPLGQQRTGCNAAASTNGCSDSDQCDGQGACDLRHAPSTQSCTDFNSCTHTDRCNGTGGCSGIGYSCFDNNQCTDDQCDGAGGCNFPNKNDGVPCGSCGMCESGFCTIDPSVDCGFCYCCMNQSSTWECIQKVTCTDVCGF